MQPARKPGSTLPNVVNLENKLIKQKNVHSEPSELHKTNMRYI